MDIQNNKIGCTWVMALRWLASEVFAPYLCHCPEVGCTGPNPIVAHMYHPGVDFRQRRV